MIFPRLPELRPFAACAAFALAISGCYVIDDNGGEPPFPADEPAQESLDTGATMEITPGRGAGLFVEYLGAGAWNVYTSCDTLVTERPCVFDVIFAVAPEVTIVAPTLSRDAEPVDRLSLQKDGSFRLLTGTASKLDGVTFSTDAGAALRIDMLLDGQARPDLIHWISGAAHVVGTTTNPVDFIPTAP